MKPSASIFIRLGYSPGYFGQLAPHFPRAICRRLYDADKAACMLVLASAAGAISFRYMISK